jgi:hypothetical protein
MGEEMGTLLGVECPERGVGWERGNSGGRAGKYGSKPISRHHVRNARPATPERLAASRDRQREKDSG